MPGRERMMAGLDALGVEYFPSEANFILMKIGARHKEFVAAMRGHGVLLRDRSTDPGCDGFVRITIGVKDQVEQGLAALKLSLADIAWTPPNRVPEVSNLRPGSEAPQVSVEANEGVLIGDRNYE